MIIISCVEKRAKSEWRVLEGPPLDCSRVLLPNCGVPAHQTSIIRRDSLRGKSIRGNGIRLLHQQPTNDDDGIDLGMKRREGIYYYYFFLSFALISISISVCCLFQSH